MAAEQWEHLVVTMFADAKAQEEFLRRTWPGEKFGPWSPQALIPLLDRFGDEGWELVSLVPVFMGKKGDMLVTAEGPVGVQRIWTNQYLCAFKRRKRA